MPKWDEAGDVYEPEDIAAGEAEVIILRREERYRVSLLNAIHLVAGEVRALAEAVRSRR